MPFLYDVKVKDEIAHVLVGHDGAQMEAGAVLVFDWKEERQRVRLANPRVTFQGEPVAGANTEGFVEGWIETDV